MVGVHHRPFPRSNRTQQPIIPPLPLPRPAVPPVGRYTRRTSQVRAPISRSLSLSLSRSLFLIFRRRTAACGETGNSREKWREHDPSYTVPEPSSNPPGPLSPRPLSPGHLSNPESLSEPSQPCIFLLYLQLVCKLFAVARPRRVARRKTSEDETGNDSKLASRVFPLGRAARWPWSVFVLERLRELVRELAARRRFPHS